MSTRTTIASAAFLLASLTLACDGEGGTSDPLFPADYAATFPEVRDCRRSADHDLNYVRVFVDPDTADAYMARTEPLPDGALLVKELHADETCTDLVGWAVMQREAGYSAEGGDWHWQDVGRDRKVKQDGKIARCASCHEDCEPPDGFDWTCAAPDDP